VIKVMGEGDRVIKVMGEGEVVNVNVNVNVLLGPWGKRAEL